MAIETATDLVEKVIAYTLIIAVAWMMWVALTGPEGDFEVVVALALLGIAYSFLHGKESLAEAIGAYRGIDLEDESHDEYDDRRDRDS